MAVTPQPGILEIELYQGGASHAPGVENVTKLSSNENPFGASDETRAAIVASAHNIHRYPSTDHRPLREAIAEVHGLDVDKIICGVGSDEILTLICQAYAGPGDEVLYTEHGFSMYPILARMAGATPVAVPERDRQVDVDALLARAGAKTRVVFLTNPGNPTSTMISGREVKRLAKGLPVDCLLVMDGAYVEYVEGFDGNVKLVEARDDVVMTRTFSKIYGLGGMRVGWGYAPQGVIDVLNRVRGPFNLSNTALAAAEAAMRDQAWVNKCRAENTRLREWMGNALAEIGVPSDASCTNFVLARFADTQEANGAEAHLRGQGLLVRKTAGYGLPHCLRITVGDEPACRQVVAAIRAFKDNLS
ncbi:Histidinol-phosphate aminotransferase [Candidatus Rhodobacter oscarellae]|uniref:Histidinol-phosphate aminotransferase n=1 Tax=Candidatus Rhodobacter oscarellae TaxID=1675527 RepID=A0A0J9H2W1_9RHOB|nr:histidinol-phosphate transaminase [Candidatus Rhodobacter lobularis]KMW60018.1 Histidinol-phosphate aminotransferase [Candidatus Rhodobacter lobularis]